MPYSTTTVAEQLEELLWLREQFEAAVAATEEPAALRRLRSVLPEIAACIDQLQEARRSQVQP